MNTNTSTGTRLLSGALSILIAFLSIAAVTHTAFARPPHQTITLADNPGTELAPRTDCPAAPGPAYRLSRKKRSCAAPKQAGFASLHTLVLQ